MDIRFSWKWEIVTFSEVKESVSVFTAEKGKSIILVQVFGGREARDDTSPHVMNTHV